MKDLDNESELNLDSNGDSDIERLYCSGEDLLLEPKNYYRKKDYHDDHIANLRKNGHLRKPRIYKWDKDL